MHHPKQIVLTFAAFDRNRPVQLKSQPADSAGLTPVRFHKLSVPFAQLEDVKNAINACFTKPEDYSTSFEGDLLARGLLSLSHSGCLNSKEVEILTSDLTGSTIQYSGAEAVDLELISGNFSIVSFKILLNVNTNSNRLAA